ncbi:MAG: hypothetical protein K0S44_3412 [Bacteroidetes bacterium]|nr:hypothetical protein [Bacteroidota bacterium]
MFTTKQNTILLTILATLLVCVFLTAQFSWRGPDRKGYAKVIDSDGKGYYMYLPSIFIKKNLGSLTPDERYVFKTEHGAVNKYFCGTAVAMLPFFGSAYAIAIITHKPLTGYSPIFHRGISMAAWFYLCLGLFFLSRLFQLYGIKTEVICIALLLIVFGTNLLMYSVYHPSFSHVYSFCFIAMFLYYAKQSFIRTELRYFLLLAFSAGMIIIIRPTNALIFITLPFIAGSAEDLKAGIKKILNYRLILGTLIFTVILSIQCMLWYIQTGHFFVQSYKYEGFYFSHPEIFNTLFSFRKGFFVYTPLILVSLSALVLIAKKSRFQFYSLLLFFLLLIYVTASWWNWYYGPSFGQRPFIEFYPINALLLALLFTSLIKIKHQRAFYIIVGLCVALNLIQSFQYVKNIISHWDMNLEKYKYTFLRTSPKYYASLGGCNDIVPYPGIKAPLRNMYNDYERITFGWTESITKSVGGERKNVCDFNDKEFNTSCDIRADSLIFSYRQLFAEISVEKNELMASGKNGPMIGISIFNPKKDAYHYQTFNMNEIPNKITNRWKTYSYSIELPKIKSKGDIIRFYIWNKDKQNFLIDNFRIRLSGIY